MQSILLIIRFFLFHQLASGLSSSLSSSSSSSTSSSVFTKSISKVDRSQFDPKTHYYHTHPTQNSNDHHSNLNTNSLLFETPVLIENAISKQECEFMCDTIVQELGGNIVDLQRKTKIVDEEDRTSIQTELMECELEEAFGYVMESQHQDAFFCFCEGIMEEHKSLEGVKGMLHRAKETLFGVVAGREEEDDMHTARKRDLFEYFPNDTKPSDCVVVAGEGATSTLHRDPFTWTGTSLCLEGTKIWRFIAPPGAVNALNKPKLQSNSGVHLVDDAVKSYRLPSVAWDDDVFLSSGWQSDMSLYSSRSDVVPSAEEFALLEETNPDEKNNEMNDIAHRLDQLTPSIDFPSRFDDEDKFPVTIWTVVQKPGDMLVIPAYWWHQTYALEPSVAIASQRSGGERDTKRVIAHIFETIGLDKHKELPTVLEELMNDTYTGTQKDISKALFEVLSSI